MLDLQPKDPSALANIIAAEASLLLAYKKLELARKQLESVEAIPPWIDRVDEMPVNENPFQPDFVRNFYGKDHYPFWPTMQYSDVLGLTIHHTGSNSAIDTANHCAYYKGYPVTQYHFWVDAGEGCPIYKLAEPTWRIWHDCTGVYPTTLSIAMAGYLHYHKPPKPQLDALVVLVSYLMDEYNIDISQVQGHRERWALKTHCPGWGPLDRSKKSWGSDWKTDFYDTLTFYRSPPVPS